MYRIPSYSKVGFSVQIGRIRIIKNFGHPQHISALLSEPPIPVPYDSGNSAYQTILYHGCYDFSFPSISGSIYGIVAIPASS